MCVGNFKPLNMYLSFFRNKSDDYLYLYARLKLVFRYTISICICVDRQISDVEILFMISICVLIQDEYCVSHLKNAKHFHFQSTQDQIQKFIQGQILFITLHNAYMYGRFLIKNVIFSHIYCSKSNIKIDIVNIGVHVFRGN